MKLAFIIQPMNGKTNSEIMHVRKKAAIYLTNKGYEIAPSFFNYTPKSKNVAVWYLGKSIEVMADADLVYLCKGWRKSRGCRIEHSIATEYGLEIEEEE